MTGIGPWRSFLWLALCAGALLPASGARAAANEYERAIAGVQPKFAKIYGAGGFRGLEPYQSGFLISDQGHILTVWSYVLDTDYITVTLNDGRRFDAKLLAADPHLEIAVLKIEATGLEHFKLEEAVKAEAGTRVLAFSNLYGVAAGNEPASVQHGWVAVVADMDARRGTYETPYTGPIYVLDAMTNNPGAAGGALTNERGELLGMLGKELRNAQSNVWLNYAIPAERMAKTVEEIIAGKFVSRPTEDPTAKPKNPLRLADVGVVLIPDVIERTPPYVDLVRKDSPAEKAGVRPDDLVLFVNDRLVQSAKTLKTEFEYIDRIDPVRLTILRGSELIEVTLEAEEP
jgi:serine protease Do